MEYPPLVKYDKPGEYKRHFEKVYCRNPVETFDGIRVRFRKDDFEHCFYESSRRNRVKDRFSWKRAKRIEWIKTALEESQFPPREIFRLFGLPVFLKGRRLLYFHEFSFKPGYGK